MTTNDVGNTRTTEPFRREHAGIREHLARLDAMVGSLGAMAPPTQQETMQKAVTFLDAHIKPHSEWEDQVLYPVLDQYARSAPEHAFTASMRHEHTIINRWIDDLARVAAEAQPDVTAFVRLADKLLGLLAAHFENEEEVLMPILDEHMTADVFWTELMARGHKH